jgi:hypothetical protein
LLLSGATMSQQSSLTQSAHSVRQVLTAYRLEARGIPAARGGKWSAVQVLDSWRGRPGPFGASVAVA